MAEDIEKRLRLLLLSAREGDKSSYQEFLEECAHFLHRFYRKYSIAEALIDDCVQNTLLALHLSRHTYREEKPLMPWLMAIARFKMVDELRRAARSEPLIEPVEEGIDPYAPTIESEAYLREQFQSVLGRMKHHYRDVFVSIHLLGRSIEETAAHLGLTDSAVKVRNHRAIRLFRRYLSEQMILVLLFLSLFYW